MQAILKTTMHNAQPATYNVSKDSWGIEHGSYTHSLQHKLVFLTIPMSP